MQFCVAWLIHISAFCSLSAACLQCDAINVKLLWKNLDTLKSTIGYGNESEFIALYVKDLK